jgi:NosR/NirI family nitrous oxide reductase transcriptional regulator
MGGWGSGRRARGGVIALALLLLACAAHAATLTRDSLQALLGAEVMVGERDANLPLWPIFRRVAAAPELVAHAFETADIEPVAGYGGKPINLLVVLDREGRVLTLRLLSHVEPIFQSPEGSALLQRFAQQYEQLTLAHQIQVLTPKAQRVVTELKATLHGISAGTVTALAIDRSIMEAAAQAAIALAGGDAPAAAVNSGADDRYQRTGWNALVAAGLVQRISLDNRAVQARFAGGPAAQLDAEGLVRPNGLAVDLWVALLGLPQAGRNLLDRAGWQQVRALREEQGVQTLLVLDDGRYPLGAPAGRSTQLVVRQGGRDIALEPLAYTHGLQKTGQRSGVGANAAVRLLRTAPGTRLDSAQPFELVLAVTRRDGDDTAHTSAPWTQRYAPADLAALQPQREQPAWLAQWQQRWVDITILVAGLVVLTAALARQGWLAANARRLAAFRIGYLVFTLGFVGWWAQGQLTIVNATSVIEALAAGRRADFLLADPMAVILWAYVGITLLVWGRGTFCGWLCPFGALQELASLVARKLGWRGLHIKLHTDHVLKRVKYVLLAAIVLAAFTSATWTERLVEVEPFKTSISLMFQRSWPYVLWALLCIGLGLFVFRGYCRYLCPLGAGLAVLGRVRLLNWIPRRAECGTPCQTCRHRCGYQAIEPSGRIDYAECFQCLDCVEIHQDSARCMPLIRARKVIRLQPA